MERESDYSNYLLQRIFLGLNQSSGPKLNAPENQEIIEHLRQENDALRKTLRMHNGLRQRFEQLYDSSPVGYLTIDSNGCIVEANLMIARLLGIQRSWLIGKNFDHYISDEDYRLFARHIDSVRNSKQANVCTLQITNNNGENITVRIESLPSLSESNSAYTTIYSSITAINQSENTNLLPNKRTESRISELTDKNEKLQQEIKYLKDTETALLKYHDQLEKAYNRQSKEIEALKNQLSKEINSHKQAKKNPEKNGRDDRQASRLNSVVELAAGLAHEINQPLSAITTYSQSCLRKLNSDKDPQRIKTLIEQILVQTKRATNIIKHLRDFISKGDTHRETTNINKVIQYAINVLRTEIIKYDIIIKVLQPKPVPQIMANTVQIEQVILNLIQNAVDALKKVPTPKRSLDISLSRSQTHIIITLHDTGPGIMQQNEDKIIKPFFTTKTDGMGLGLTISQAIVQDHGGQLIYKKDMAKGATFQVTLAIDGRNKFNQDS